MPEKRLKTMDDLPLSGKRVLVRVDFNVTVGSDGVVDENEDFRIEAALPTIQDLRQKRCKIILLTHLGRPGEEDGNFDVRPIKRRLEELLGEEIKITDALYGNKVETAVSSLEPGGILLLPNVRLDEREMTANEKFGAELSHAADAYVGEAFSNAHRAHTSMVVLPRLLPSCAGKRMVKEVEALSRLLHASDKPYVAITSGAKITTKIGMLKQLLSKVDTLVVGGQIANVFLAALGKWPVEKYHPDEIAAALSLLETHKDKLLLPVDVVIGDKDGTASSLITVDVDGIPQGAFGIFDIGPKSIENIVNVCAKAKTVMWNGPVGKFETPAYEVATKSLAQQLSAQTAFRVVGGGDTVNALEKYHLIKKFDHVSTGGGAMIEFLEGKPMPGLEPLYE